MVYKYTLAIDRLYARTYRKDTSMKVGKYLFSLTIEHNLIGIGIAKCSATGDITVEEETPRFEIESKVVRMSSRQAKNELVQQGYIVSNDEPKTVSFLIEPL